MTFGTRESKTKKKPPTRPDKSPRVTKDKSPKATKEIPSRSSQIKDKARDTAADQALFNDYESDTDIVNSETEILSNYEEESKD